MKALIVDDDVFVRKCLMQMLPWNELDFSQVLEAANGADALELALRENVDLVITDVKMPQMDGLELSRELNRHLVDLCVLVLSEYSDFEYAQKALNYGVHDYILKPLTQERLRAMEQKIRAASSEIVKRRYFTTLRTDPTAMREMIREALENADAQSLAEAFRYMFYNQIHKDDLKRFTLAFSSELLEQADAFTSSHGDMTALKEDALLKLKRVKQIAELTELAEDTIGKCFALFNTGSPVSITHVERVIEYIENNYMNPDLSVTQVSECMGLSPVYTGVLFKKCKGKSIVSYIHEVRLREAKKLLMDSSISVKETSARVGYITPDYFSRLFNTATGVIPSKYRAAMLEKERAAQAAKKP